MMKYLFYLLLLGMFFTPPPLFAQTDFSHWNYLHNPPSTIQQFHVSPTGSSTSDGSEVHPWNLQTALSGGTATVKVKPGDIIWVQGGVYEGAFVSNLTGTEGKSIYVKVIDGERATLDGRNSGYYDVNGSLKSPAILQVSNGLTDHVVFWGLEIMSSYPARLVTGSDEGVRGDGVFTTAPHVDFINMVVHDASQGYGYWSTADGADIYGNIIFNNGHTGSNLHHGIYCQSNPGTSKSINGNIIFNHYAWNLHCYGQGGELHNITIDRNILMSGRNLIGGYLPVVNNVFSNNHVIGNTLEYGYWTRPEYVNDTALVTGNIMTHGITLDERWKNVTITDNVFYRFLDMTKLEEQFFPSSFVMERNTYVFTGTNVANLAPNPPFSGKTIDQMRTLYGFELAGEHLKQLPTGVKTQVIPNKYEPGRAHIMIYNWDLRDEVHVDISNLGYGEGDRLIVRNAFDYYDDVQTVTYAPILQIDMRNRTIAQTIGDPSRVEYNPYPTYGAFVIESDATPGVQPTIPVVLGDTDGDNDVDIFDYNVIISNFGQTVSGPINGDVDNDNDVDIFDYNLVITNFGM